MSRILHRASWLATGSAGHDQPPLFKDGGVLVENGLINKVGSFSELAGLAQEVVDHQNSILIPALVNCHSHLELSWMATEKGSQLASLHPGDFVGWIRGLLSLRTQEPEKEIRRLSFLKAKKQLGALGTGFLVDTGNAMPDDYYLQNNLPSFFLLELLGLTGKLQDEAIKKIANLPEDIICTPHAPYSTGPNLLRRLKKRSTEKRQLFSIHTAESTDEIEFLQNGSGPFKPFLAERGISLSSFTVPKTGSVHYLDKLGLLDNKTLCVHCVHLTDDEIDIIAVRGTKIILCPGSNRYLGVGKAPVNKFLQRSILPALGTDSLASNSSLSLWEEMRVLQEDWPGIDPRIIFAMAASGGGQALGDKSIYGQLAPGKSPRFLAVETPSPLQEKDVFSFLTTVGKSVKIKWVEG